MTRKASIRDVAKRAGVSPSTVSRVLNGNSDVNMRPDTKQRVLDAIEELHYTPTRSAQRLRRQQRDIVGVLVPDISNPYFSLLARGVETVAFEENLSTLICDSNHSADREARYLDLLLAEQVDGIVFVPVGVPDWKRIERLQEQGTRIVVADRCLDGLLGVEAANWKGSYDLTRHVLGLGHKQIAYIAGTSEARTTVERVRGFTEAMTEAGIEPVDVRYGEYTYESGFQIAMGLFESCRVDAVMGGDDLVALGAIRAAEQSGFSVPDDLSVTGFDAVPVLSVLHQQLSSVRIPVSQIGQESMAMLLRHIRSADLDMERQTLPVELIPGSSCKRRESGLSWKNAPLPGAPEEGGG